MTLRTQYSSEEIEVLESYSHRLNNKVHISFPGGTFGDMLWSSIFVTNALSHINDISEKCSITPEGRVQPEQSDVRDSTHFAFKLGNAIEDKLKTRHDILFAVYMGVNKSTLEDPISEPDNKNNDYGWNIIDTVLSHCCVMGSAGLMSLFETEFNQKLIFLLPNKIDAEFYGEICSRKTDPKKEWGKMIPDVDFIKKNITDNTLVINPNRFVLDEETYIECVKEILGFIEMKVDTDTVNKIVSYRTVWYNNQPKYILDYDFSTF
ncbi:MAG: hypothetical protein H8D95_00020 [Candidatus Endolissoclinum sp.]|nr:hypothetical protein [Candidatus Endolissoclinum sp.]